MHQDYDYVIIGGGMAADAAAKGIRERDTQGSIAILGEEPTPPFPRPALSKKLWTDPDFGFDDAALSTADETGAELHLGSRVTTLDPAAKLITTDDGETYAYEKALIATGGHPKHVDGLAPGPRVLYFRTLTDYRHLRELSTHQPHVAVVGGSYIGTEIAAALVQNGCTVTLVHPEDVLGGSMFPPELAARYESRFTEAGATLHGGARVEGGHVREDGVTLVLDDGARLDVDVVVVGLGIEPAGDVARDAGLEVAEDGGVVVDEHLRTSDPDVLAAGDVAQYPDRILGRRRVEHVDNATEMGTTAGRVLAGSDEVYDHTPSFYSDVFEIGWEAVGTLDSSLETVVDGDGEAAVVYYLDDDGVVGVLLWNVWDSVDAAREVIARHERPESFEQLIEH